MKKILQMTTMMVASVWPLAMAAQTPVVAQRLPNADNEPLPVFPVPSERQLKWQETEF
jgi:alpha-L-fucosidase